MQWRELIRRRSRAYKQTFSGLSAGPVLADLARFCHASKTVHVDGNTHGTAQLEGRRQVWLRIQGYVQVDERELEKMVEEEGNE